MQEENSLSCSRNIYPVPFSNKGDTNELIMRWEGGTGETEERRGAVVSERSARCSHHENQLSESVLDSLVPRPFPRR